MKKSIVISGPPAVGKTTVAKALAEEFGLKYLGGGDVLKELAKEEGYTTSGDDWWDTKGGMDFLGQREKNSEFDKKVDQKLIELFKDGGMVITSYTLPWLVENGIKIWLDGSHSSSIKRMQTRDNLSSDEAYAITKERYDKNKALYKKLYNFEFGADSEIFDEIIDTDNRDASEVIKISKKTVKKLI